MIKTESKTGRGVLMVAHCAGMVDLIALPVWVGTLISHYGFDPQQAGGLATLFLFGAVMSSLFFAPRLNRISGRVAAPMGFGAAALAFMIMSTTKDFTLLAALHALAGASAGCALSFTHGTIGRSANPHRLFALAGIAIAFFGFVFMAGTPQFINAAGGQALFWVFGGVMAFASVTCALAFPMPDAVVEGAHAAQGQVDKTVWFAVFGVSCLAVVQSMIFSFIERIGSDRGFSFEAVSGVLLAVGLANFAPPPLAALLQGRLRPTSVMMAGPILQALLALVITNTSTFPPYAVASVLFVPVMIFTHAFAFGLLASLDPSGRIVAATPAMLMIGAAIGPVLGGTLVKVSGYGSLAIAAAVVASLAVASFSRVTRVSKGLSPAHHAA